MAIIDVELFDRLAPRSTKKILCKCDRCGEEAFVQKVNLFRIWKDGKTVFYKKGQEPKGFIPNYDYCIPCDRIVNPTRLGQKASEETIVKIKAARLRQHLEGKTRPMTEDLRAKLSTMKRGSLNPQWKDDREMVAKSRRMARVCSNLIWNTLNRTSQKDGGQFKDLVGFSRQYLIEWIEGQFTEGMSWDNIAIDHIIPVVAFVRHGITDLRVINHPSNLRPMFRLENISKGDKYDPQAFRDYLQAVGYVHSFTETVDSPGNCDQRSA